MREEPPVAPDHVRMGEGPESGREKVAVLVVHGMGQQVQYETLDRAVKGLARTQPEAPHVDLAAVRWGEEEFRRAEVQLGDVDVHVYEGYWAPITEGKVRLRDVSSFFARSVANGLRNARGTFARWSFGAARERKAGPGTFAAMSVATLFLASLVVLDLFAALITGGKLASGGWVTAATVSDATWLALIFVLTLVNAGIWMAVGLEFRKFRKLRETDVVLLPGWVTLALAVVAGIVAGLGILALLAYQAIAQPAGPLAGSPPEWAIPLLWGAIFLASLVVRHLLVEYVGDVAAYVSPHALDRFQQARADIRAAVKRVAARVYEAKDERGRPYYARVAVVGHSLGSVIGYDTLNALLRDDAFAAPGRERGVQARTCLFLTFGSPLDKTAFVFATAAQRTTPVREGFAALSQPLILAKEHRTFPWVNVHSPSDIVSGSLEYYDGPGGKPCVYNVRDTQARTPLLAHNEYWENETVWRLLREAIVMRHVTVVERGVRVVVKIPVAVEEGAPGAAPQVRP